MELIRRTNSTYFIHITGNRTSPGITFERGPERPTNVTISGTTVLDPNDPTRVLLFGGMNPPRQPTANFDRINLVVFFFTDGQIAHGHNIAPAENWIAETFSPPYTFIDGNRRTTFNQIQWVRTANPVPPNYLPENDIGGKTYFLWLSGQTYQLFLGQLPQDCAVDGGNTSVVLIKLGCSTHGWDTGQRLYSFPFHMLPGHSQALELITPDAAAQHIAPAFYHLFYVDCHGKPSAGAMVRFDDSAVEP